MSGENIRIFVCGDVMTGRGIDQILGHPCDPRVNESYLKDARNYVATIHVKSRMKERENNHVI